MLSEYYNYVIFKIDTRITYVIGMLSGNMLLDVFFKDLLLPFADRYRKYGKAEENLISKNGICTLITYGVLN